MRNNALDAVMSGEALLLDVRTKEERSMGAAELSVHLDLSSMMSGASPNVLKDHPIYIYCQTGSRATYAKSLLEQRGYTDVTDVGGLNNWLRASSEKDR